MKRLILWALLLTLISGMMNSCEVETSDNGSLDGFWHLEQVDTLATGGICDFSDKRVYWGVQYQLVSISDYDLFKGYRGYYSRFTQTHDSLILTKLYRNYWHQNVGGDIPVEEVNDSLRSCGINTLEEHFAKESLNNSQMILKNKNLRLHFRKF